MSETYTKAEVEELVNKVKSETVAEFSGKLEELKAETAASNAKAEANALLAAGKIEASEVEHTASILMSDGADAFRKLLDARGTASTEAGSGGKQQVKWSKDAESIFAGLGLDAEEIEAATKDLATA